MTWHEAYRDFMTRIRSIYEAGEADRITSWIFETIAGSGKTDVIRKRDEQMPEGTLKMLELAFGRIMEHEPVQYVTGHAWFHGMEFRVGPSVLIPRPETEELVEQLFQFSHLPQAKILDIGTGSGCIAITIKKKWPDAQVTAIDFSKPALETAATNAAMHEADVDFRQIDFLDEGIWPELGTYDFIISNPPYVPISEKETLAPHVRDREPHSALFPPGDDPMLFYKKIALFGKEHLSANGRMLLEIHNLLAEETKETFSAAGYDTELRKDIYGNARMLIVSRCL